MRPLIIFKTIRQPRIEEDGANGELPESKRKEARTDTQLPTRIGDLHDVETEPPENFYIVCYLDPDTSGDGLKIIFSPFGEILLRCHSRFTNRRLLGVRLYRI